jgi:DNA-binding IclR family transcriptional regulator
MTDGHIGATQKSLTLLQTVFDAGGATLEELIDRTGYARGTVHAHVRTLEENDLVTKDGTIYRISLGVLTFGGQARARYPLYFHTHDELEQLATEHEALVQIAVREDDLCLYIYQIGREYSNLTRPRLGTRVNYHSSAVGKALLSTLPLEERERILDASDFREHTPQTQTDRESILDEIETTAEDRVAYDFEEQFEGVACASTPLEFEDDAAALSVSVPATDVSREYLTGELADDIFRVGRELELDATYEEWGIAV